MELNNTVLIPISIEALGLMIDNAVARGIAMAKSAEAAIVDKKDDEWLSRKEARQLLKISNVTIIDWGKKNIIKCYKIGGKVKYRRSELESAMKEKN